MKTHLKNYTVIALKPGTKKPQKAVALTIASTPEEAIKRVLRLHTPKDPALFDDDLIAVDSYSALSTMFIEAEGWENVNAAVAEYALYEATILDKRPARVTKRAPKRRARAAGADTTATVAKLSAPTVKEQAQLIAKLVADAVRTELAGRESETLDRVELPAEVVANAKAEGGALFRIKKDADFTTKRVKFNVAEVGAALDEPKERLAAKAEVKRLATPKPKAKPKAKVKPKPKAKKIIKRKRA